MCCGWIVDGTVAGLHFETMVERKAYMWLNGSGVEAAL